MGMQRPLLCGQGGWQVQGGLREAADQSTGCGVASKEVVWNTTEPGCRLQPCAGAQPPCRGQAQGVSTGSLPPLPGPAACCRKVQDGCAMALQLEEDKHLILKLVQQQVGLRGAARAGGCQGRAGVVLRPSPPQWVRG